MSNKNAKTADTIHNSVHNYRPRQPHERTRVQSFNTEPSRTMQADQAACDINNIMARYQKTGIIEHVRKTEGRYGDFADVPTYQEALNQVLIAQDAFASLPSSIRSKFHNDPAEFLQFVHNPDNADEMLKLGLRKPPETVPVEKAPTEPKKTEAPTGPSKGSET